MSYAASTISDYNDIILDDNGAPIAKFWTGTPGAADYIPMVIEAVNGDPEAITDGFAPAGVFGPDPVQLCVANHPGYSSDVAFQVNLGGALGDLNWLDSGDPAMISIQCPADQFAPYTTGVLVVPTTGENVVEVSGAFDIHAEINGQMAPNNNEPYQSLGLTDEFSMQAAANGNMGWDGLYPVKNDYVNNSPTQPFDGAPWQWWDVATTNCRCRKWNNGCSNTTHLNPNMGPLKSGILRHHCGLLCTAHGCRLGLAVQGPGCDDSSACNYNLLRHPTMAPAPTQMQVSIAKAMPLPRLHRPHGLQLRQHGANDDGSCDYLETDSIPTGADNVWLVGLTLSGTAFEALAGGCEADGGVNPNVSINGVIVGDGATALTFDGITDPTGLLGDLVAIASSASLGICGDAITIAAGGNVVPLVGNGQFWQSPVPITEDGRHLWVHPWPTSMWAKDPTLTNSQALRFELACTYDVVLPDMNPALTQTTSVAWAGTANGRNNTSNPMSDDDGDGVYEVTISLLAANEYKLIQNADLGLVETFNGSDRTTLQESLSTVL